MIQAAVILPAAGAGQRFAAGASASASKIEFELHGKPVFMRSIEAFHGRPDVCAILLAIAPDRLEEFRFRWEDQLGFMGIKLIAGGKAERWETVRRALEHVPGDATHVAVHDAARPCVSQRFIDRVFEAAQQFDAVIPGVAVPDTLKRVSAESVSPPADDPLDAILGGASSSVSDAKRVIETVPRKQLVGVQTPQVFKAELLARAYANLPADASSITDDAGLIEAMGHEVIVVPGEPSNLKLTRPEDVELLTALLASRETNEKQAAARKFLLDDDDD
jgi:2-C-methyl-D-erythritol 4-phosphate cytidylyltransferase